METRNTRVLEAEAGYYAIRPENRGDAGVVSKTPSANTETTKADFVYGYAGNIAVRVPESPTKRSDVPRLVMGFTASKPSVNISGETISILNSVVTDRGHLPGRVGGDRAYWGQRKVEDLHMPTRALGFDVITSYVATDLGAKGGKHGAIFVEGKTLCPATPLPLVNASVEYTKGEINETTYWNRLDERKKYEFRAKEKPDERGVQAMMCPAFGKGATVECPFRAKHALSSKKLKPVVLDAALPEAPDKACTQTSVDFHEDDNLKMKQAFDFGTREWGETYQHDRNSIEGLNALIKDSATHAFAAPERRRSRGLAAQQVLLTFVLVAFNLTQIDNFLTKEKARKMLPTGPEKSKMPRARDKNGDSNYNFAGHLRAMGVIVPDYDVDNPPLKT